MKKHLFYPALWGILALSTLSSCRTEDGAITQKQVEDKRFAVFVPESGKTVNYATGFVFLMQRYDNLHKTNLSGMNNNKPIIGNLNASTNKNDLIAQPSGSYVEFRIHSQTVTGKDGDKWVVFPKVEGNRVTGLILAFLSNKETNVSYKTIDSQTEWYNENIGKFQDTFTNFQKYSKFLNLSASINPMADGAGCKNQNGEYVDCGIEEVIITVPKDPGTPLPPVTIIVPIIDHGTCNDFQNCTSGGGGGESLPTDDSCNKNKSITNNATFKENVKALEGKTSDGSEFGYRMSLPIPNGNPNQFLTSKVGSKQVDMSVFPNTYGIMHSHYDGLYPMFSPEDLIMFDRWVNYVYNNNQVQNPGTPIPQLDDIFLTVITSEGTYMLKFDPNIIPTQLPNYTQKEFDNLNTDYENALNEGIKVANVSGNVSYDMKTIEKGFLKFVTDKMNIPGLKLIRVENEGNTEFTTQNGQVKEKNCN
ncbi:TPA: hypothetical protein ACGZ99_002491 [Elizabethkingia anophelis]|uniref:hypothetical protein n=1 Tax=Elizabethkingia anophelis TaxID=1117645 RepID=UPI0021A54E94|nr:hypothetical protein [Elizabethkingia anophelis]